MKLLNEPDLQMLLNQSGRWCVSVYLPTHRIAPDALEDPIRLKNLLSTVESRLLSLGMKRRAIDRLLKPAWGLMEDKLFWVEQNEGLAIFIHQSFFHYFNLPEAVPALAVVTERFHLTPLLDALSAAHPYHLLLLNQNRVKFYAGTQYSLEELQLPDLPTSLDEALGGEEADRQLQVHTGPGQREGKSGAIFHGQGGMTVQHKDRLLRFFRQIQASVRRHLTGSGAPLVLAGVEYLLPIYREVNTYPPP